MRKKERVAQRMGKEKPSPDALPPLEELIRRHFDLMDQPASGQTGRSAISLVSGGILKEDDKRRMQILSSRRILEFAAEACQCRELHEQRRRAITNEAAAMTQEDGQARPLSPLSEGMKAEDYLHRRLIEAGVVNAVVFNGRMIDGIRVVRVIHDKGNFSVRDDPGTLKEDADTIIGALGLEREVRDDVPYERTGFGSLDIRFEGIQRIGDRAFALYTYLHDGLQSTLDIPEGCDESIGMGILSRKIIGLHNDAEVQYTPRLLDSVVAHLISPSRHPGIRNETEGLADTLAFLASGLGGDGLDAVQMPEVGIRFTLLPESHKKALARIADLPDPAPLRLMADEKGHLEDAFREVGFGSSPLCEESLADLAKAFDTLRGSDMTVPYGTGPLEGRMSSLPPAEIETRKAGIISFIRQEIERMEDQGIVS